VTTHLKAKYIGSEPEPGYHAGQMYFLEVRQHWFGKITIRPTHGYRFKPLSDMRLVYHNLESFLGSWKVLHVVDTGE
jgi:hypothetical protein